MSDLQTVRELLADQLDSLRRAGVEQLPVRRSSTDSQAHRDESPARVEIPPVAAPAVATSPRESIMPAATKPQATSPLPVAGRREGSDIARRQETSEEARSMNQGGSLADLRREVMACTRCPILVDNRTQTVFGVGKAGASLCFLGEAPGADEDRQGEPFVGRAGELLNKMIAACTLRREDIYILNVLKCRPPDNRAPLPDEVENCRPFFERQLEILAPRFICCLGAVAAQSLLRTTTPVGKLRGTIHAWKSARVVVTYHPAYLLRAPNQKRAAWDDLQLLMTQMGLKPPDSQP